LKDGKPLTAKDVEAIVHDDKVIFNIKKPAHALSGNYQIKLKNDQGEDIKDVHINMQGNVLLTIYSHYFSVNTLIVHAIINIRINTFKYQNSNKRWKK